MAELLRGEPREVEVAARFGRDHLEYFRTKHRTGAQAEASEIVQGSLWLCGADWLKEHFDWTAGTGLLVTNGAGADDGRGSGPVGEATDAASGARDAISEARESMATSDDARSGSSEGAATDAPPCLPGGAGLRSGETAPAGCSITHVLNMAGHEIGGSMVDGVERAYPRAEMAAAGIELREYECDDTDKWCDEHDAAAVVGEAAAFIHDAVRGGGRVLVHCSAGQSRSATAVIAYVMQHGGAVADGGTGGGGGGAAAGMPLSLFDAMQLVRARRKFTYPGPGFLRTLMVMETRLRGSCSLQAGEVAALHLSSEDAASVWHAAPSEGDLVRSLCELVGDSSAETAARASEALADCGGDLSAAAALMLGLGGAIGQSSAAR